MKKFGGGGGHGGRGEEGEETMLLVYRKDGILFRVGNTLQRSLDSHSHRIWKLTGLAIFWLGDQRHDVATN